MTPVFLKSSLLALFFILSRFLHAQQDTIAPVKDSLQPAQVETGIASYYAKKFHGRKTSSGERFHNDSLTAAHKTLPLGTYVKVTNLKNDSVVVVKINDRLPKKSRRSIDLSQKAARQLNFMKAGLTKVNIEVLNPDFKK